MSAASIIILWFGAVVIAIYLAHHVIRALLDIQEQLDEILEQLKRK